MKYIAEAEVADCSLESHTTNAPDTTQKRGNSQGASRNRVHQKQTASRGGQRPHRGERLGEQSRTQGKSLQLGTTQRGGCARETHAGTRSSTSQQHSLLLPKVLKRELWLSLLMSLGQFAFNLWI